MCVHQEEEIKELELQLDIRAKDLKTQEAMLFSQVLLSKIRCFWDILFLPICMTILCFYKYNKFNKCLRDIKCAI